MRQKKIKMKIETVNIQNKNKVKKISMQRVTQCNIKGVICNS